MNYVPVCIRGCDRYTESHITGDDIASGNRPVAYAVGCGALKYDHPVTAITERVCSSHISAYVVTKHDVAGSVCRDYHHTNVLIPGYHVSCPSFSPSYYIIRRNDYDSLLISKRIYPRHIGANKITLHKVSSGVIASVIEKKDYSCSLIARYYVSRP